MTDVEHDQKMTDALARWHAWKPEDALDGLAIWAGVNETLHLAMTQNKPLIRDGVIVYDVDGVAVRDLTTNIEAVAVHKRWIACVKAVGGVYPLPASGRQLP